MITASSVTDQSGSKVNTWKTDRALSWRLIHDGSAILALFESDGITETKNNLFEGTQAQCITEANRLGLTGLNEIVATIVREQLKTAYAQSKAQGESELDFAASLIVEMGTTDLTAVATALSAKRGTVTEPKTP